MLCAFTDALSCLSELQAVTKNSKEPLNVHPDGSRKVSATSATSQKDEEARPAAHQDQLELESPSVGSDTLVSFGRPVFERHMLHELLDPAVPEDEPTDCTQEDEGAFAIQPPSEEEYEEDIIEPRTLNEVTTITDKTSPWSSVLSEVEQQPPGTDDQCLVDISSLRRGDSRQSSTFSSILQDDNQSALSPCTSLRAGESGAWEVTEGFKSLSSGTETTEKELIQPAHQSEEHQTAHGPAEDGSWGWDGVFNAELTEQNREFHAASKELLEMPPDVALTNPKTTDGEGKNSAVVNDDQGEEESGSDGLGIMSVLAQAGSEGNGESCSDDSRGDPLEESQKSIKPKILYPSLPLTTCCIQGAHPASQLESNWPREGEIPCVEPFPGNGSGTGDPGRCGQTPLCSFSHKR